MKVGTLFSGIGAPEVAWRALGFDFRWCAEIEAFPSAVLAHHYPDTPNLGDVTKVNWDAVEPVDLIAFGTPCQSFSVAGKRLGLDDPRGNLALFALRVARQLRPRWLVFENVPGLLSTDEWKAFGTFLGLLGECGYGWAYRILDAQYFGVPQRRRRVFVIGYLGDWRRAAAVLFERESLSGHPAPRRETGEGIAPTIAARAKGGGGLGTDFDCDGGLIANALHASDGQHAVRRDADNLRARSLNAHPGRIDGESETFIVDTLTVGANQTTEFIGDCVAHSLRADGFDASEDGTGRGTPLIWQGGSNQDQICAPDAVSPTLAFSNGAHGGHYQPKIAAFNWQSGGDCRGLELAKTAQIQREQSPAVVFAQNQRGELLAKDVADSLKVGGGKPGQGYPAAMQGISVRRLTPRECERLQGFPDDFTLIPYRRKPAADGPRYRALGNSMAVPVVRWLGQRIREVA